MFGYTDELEQEYAGVRILPHDGCCRTLQRIPALCPTATPYTSTIGDYAFTSTFPSHQLLLGEMKFPGDGTVTGKWSVPKRASSLQVCNDTITGTVVKDDFLTNAFDMVLNVAGECRKPAGLTVSFRAEPYLGQTGFAWTAILNRNGLIPAKGEAHAQLGADVAPGD